MTMTEYKKRVQKIKEDAAASVQRSGNPAIAMVTKKCWINSFVAMMKAILEAIGYVVHWYEFDEDADLLWEIADLKENGKYDKVFVFEKDVLDMQIYDAAYRVIIDLLKEMDWIQKITILGSHTSLLLELAHMNKIVCNIPFGFEFACDRYIAQSDVTLILDPRYRVYCGRKDSNMFFQIYNKSIVDGENCYVYNLAEEIIYKVVNS